jgi:ADP-ribosylglycohydrolase
MRGFGTHNQPPGTWSDDSSLTFCLAESLVDGYDLQNLAQRFVNWYDHGYWTPHGEVFDVGGATAEAIARLREGKVPPQQAGGRADHDNGNGSLMRILPLVFFHQNLPVAQRYQMVREVSSLTHGHLRSVFSCFFYLEVARGVLQGLDPQPAYEQAIRISLECSKTEVFPQADLRLFHRVLEGNIPKLARFQVHSSGYVIHALEASLWAWLTTESYEAAVLTAVNLGADTDTTAAIAGGLAGLTYGQNGIPMHWLQQLVRKDDITDLADRLYHRLNGSNGEQSGMVA